MASQDHVQQRANSSDLDVEKRGAAEKVTQDDIEYPTGIKLVLCLASIFLAMFLVALDRTIIATAVPRITDEFNSLNDQGWYASAYLLTSCATQLLFGRIYKFYSSKIIFLSSIVLFEIGSTICGAAPNSVAFILGRAIAGLGTAGIFSGNIVLLQEVSPLHKRPIYTGMMGAIFGISSVIGPLLGGAFTENVTWRWCFYLNLPIGAFAFIVLSFILHPKPVECNFTLREQFVKLDPLGTLVFIPGIVCVLLALQWGGTEYAWSSARIIVLFVIGGLLLLTFAGLQVVLGENATIPLHIIKRRSISFGAIFMLCVGGAMITMMYFLPLWFQAIKAVSAVRSGIDTLPFIMGVVIASIASGILITKIGYYVPFMIFGPVAMSIGAGMITTFTPETSTATWVGWQILFGVGIGAGMQQASLAAQAILERSDVSMGVSIMFFAQSLGGAVFICIAQAIFTNKLSSGLASVGINPDTILRTGATDLRTSVPVAALAEVLNVYNDALVRGAVIVALAISCFAVLPALGMEWRSVKKEKAAPRSETSSQAEKPELISEAK